MKRRTFESLIDKKIDEFRSHAEGTLLSLGFVHSTELNQVRRAAKEGHEAARVIMSAIYEWARQVDEAVKAGLEPACGYCGITLRRREVYGFMILAPKTGMGLTCGYCEACAKRDEEELCRSFKEQLPEEVGVLLAPLQ
jgi:hypothetical protein